MYKNKKNNLKKYVIAGVTIALVGTGAFVVKNFNSCGIPTKHKHLYINGRGYVTYLENETNNVEGFKKQKNYQLITSNDKRLEKKLLENKMVPIAQNLSLIRDISNSLGWEELSGYTSTGEPIYTRACFYAYKYDKETDSFIKSHYVANLEDIMNEYPYISINGMYDIVDANHLYDYYDDFLENLGEDNSPKCFEDKENYTGDFVNPNDSFFGYSGDLGDIEEYFNSPDSSWFEDNGNTLNSEVEVKTKIKKC